MTKRSNTPIIKPQLKVQFEQINFKIDTQTLEKLRAYSELIESDLSYVIREALNHLFESDAAFQSLLLSKLNHQKDESNGTTKNQLTPLNQDQVPSLH